MPKGQYTRKPRNPAPEAEPKAASLYQGENPHFPSEPARVYTDPADVPEPFHFEPNEIQARVIAEEKAKAETKEPYGLRRRVDPDGVRFEPVDKATFDNEMAALDAAQPKRESFDDWVAEDLPPVPDDTMVQRKVSGWAGAVCPIRHAVMWQPVNDGKSIEVMLTTDHGTNRMVKPAGQWTEADIDFALEAMAKELGA